MVDYNLNFIGLKVLLFAFIGIVQNYNIFHNSEFAERISFYLNGKSLRTFKFYLLFMPVIIFLITSFQALGYYHIKQIELGSSDSHNLAKLTPFKMQYVQQSVSSSYVKKYPSYWPVQSAAGNHKEALELNSLNNFRLYYEYYLQNPTEIDTDLIEIVELLKQYLGLLKLNTHQTVVTENPYYATQLAKLFKQEDLALQLVDAYRNELQKFNDRFQIKLLPKTLPDA